MKENLRIARRLVRIARSLMAGNGYSEYERSRWWYAGDKTSQVVKSLRNENTVMRNSGAYQFYIHEERSHVSVSCNLEVSQNRDTITMRAFNFWESHYDDQNYGDWVENAIPMRELGLDGIRPGTFTRVSDEDTAARVQAYADLLKARLAAAADALEEIAVPSFN